MSYYSTTILARNPQAYWRLDEASGTVAHDATTNAYNGTLSGTITYNQAGAISGDSDKALGFGTTATLQLPYTLNPTTWAALSLECWIKQSGTYQHLVVTTDASSTIVYLNGASVAPGGSGDPILISQDLAWVGSYQAGELDEPVLYDYILTPAQILQSFILGTQLRTGGCALMANGTGTAIFSSFLATLYPDPELFLTNVGRATSSLVNWNANLPTNTGVAVATSVDGGTSYQSVPAAGDAIPNLSLPAAPFVDSFTADDHASYTQTSVGELGRDTFTRANQSGWGTSSDGQAWSELYGSGTITITSNQACIAQPSSYNLLVLGSTPITNMDALVRFSLGNTSDIADIVLRASPSQGYHFEAGSTFIQIYSQVGGYTQLAAAGATCTPGTYYWIRARCVGTSLSMRFWADGASEPGIWNLTATDSNYASGGFGLEGNANSATPIKFDHFACNTSAASIVTWSWDTAHSRLVGTGGTNQILRYDGLSVSDVIASADLDIAQNAGLVARMSDPNNLYIAYLEDSSFGSICSLWKVVAGVFTQLGSTVGFAMVNNTHHQAQLSTIGTTIAVSLDGVTLISVTDSSLAGPGKIGISSGTSVRCYELRADSQGPDVTSKAVYTQMTLTSTDPTVTPQILDLETFVGSASFGAGTLIPNAPYNGSNSYVSNDIEDAKNQSNYWWYTGSIQNSAGLYPITFAARTAVPAPWPLDENNTQMIGGQPIGDILLANLNVANIANLYRNRQIIKGAILTATYTQSFTGDGKTRTWNTANPLASPPSSWTLNSLPVTFGLSGVDSGKQFYYATGSTSLTQDSSGTLLQATDVLAVTYSGSSVVDMVRDNTAFVGTVTQSAMAAITGDSGIVENIVDVSGQNMTVAAAEVYGDQMLQRYGVIGVTLNFTTLRAGLAPGQQLTVYAPSIGVNDLQMLVVSVNTTEELTPAVAGGVLYVYKVVASTSAALGSWVKLLASGLSS